MRTLLRRSPPAAERATPPALGVGARPVAPGAGARNAHRFGAFAIDRVAPIQRVTSDVIQCARFKDKEYVRVNDDPPWYGRVVGDPVKDLYSVEVGGTGTAAKMATETEAYVPAKLGTLRQVPESQLTEHPVIAAMRLQKSFQALETPPSAVFLKGDRVYVPMTGLMGTFGTVVKRAGGNTYTVSIDDVQKDIGGDQLTLVRKLPRETKPIGVELERAQYVADLSSLDPKKTLVMRAKNSGDMYHVKMSLVLSDDLDVLICDVNKTTAKQAQDAIDLMQDAGPRHRRYYTDAPNVPKTFSMSETTATAQIEQRLTQKPYEALGEEDLRTLRTSKSNDLREWATSRYRRALVRGAAKAFAPYEPQQAESFQTDLEKKGNFPQTKPGAPRLTGKSYVIVNFRATGHSNRPGANAPALDTGVAGVEQIIGAVQGALPEAVIVPMGEEPQALKNGPNLLQYWTWKSASNRALQAALLRYLNEHYTIAGAVGMRSGVMDQLAFVGIKILSIDISPHRYEKETGSRLSASKGWSRGMKLERAYGADYGRVFLKHAREDEQTPNVPNWKGAFHKEDVATIQDAVKYYLSDQGKGSVRHGSHPLSGAALIDALKRFEEQLLIPRTALEIAKRLRPYINEVSEHANDLSELGEKKLREVQKQIKALHSVVHDALTAREVFAAKKIGLKAAFSVGYMEDHIYGDLLKAQPNETSNTIDSQAKAVIAEGQRLGIAPEHAVQAYRACYELYSAVKEPVLKS